MVLEYPNSLGQCCFLHISMERLQINYLIESMAIINQWVLTFNYFMLAKNFVDRRQMQ